VIIIDMSQFRAGNTEREAQAAVRRLLFPMLQQAEDKPHVHSYALVLMDQDNGTGVELTAFEAPCPNGNDAGHVRALVDNLRELADEIRDAHADLLAEDMPAPATHGEMPSHMLVDLLGLAHAKVTVEEVMAWTPEQRAEAANWAGAVHFGASDNDVTVPDQPMHVAQGDFFVGDIVRNRHTGAVLMVTGGGAWLNSFYELVSERKYSTPGPGATATDAPDTAHAEDEQHADPNAGWRDETTGLMGGGLVADETRER
jgi:hypothetical protein